MAAAARSRSRADRDPNRPRAQNDAYTGLLVISLAAMIAGCVLLYMVFSQYPAGKPELPPQGNPIKTPAKAPPAPAP